MHFEFLVSDKIDALSPSLTIPVSFLPPFTEPPTRFLLVSDASFTTG